MTSADRPEYPLESDSLCMYPGNKLAHELVLDLVSAWRIQDSDPLKAIKNSADSAGMTCGH